MEKKETKKLIKEMINQVDEEKTLRRILFDNHNNNWG